MWGDATTGTMLNVDALVAKLRQELAAGSIVANATAPNGYSLIPVHAWSHNVSDVVQAANMLTATGDFAIITPSALLAAVRALVLPVFCM